MGSTADNACLIPDPFPTTADGIEAADWGYRTARVEESLRTVG